MANIHDNLNRIYNILNNIRQNQNFLIDLSIDTNPTRRWRRESLLNYSNSLNNINESHSLNRPNVYNNNTSRPPRTPHPPRTHNTNNTNNSTNPTNPTNRTNPTNLGRNIPSNVEISFIDPRNNSSLSSIFNTLFTEHTENTIDTLTFNDILEHTEIDTKIYENEETSKDMCPICRDDINNYNIIRKIKKCGHIFHQKCLDSWLKDNVTCPNCRQDIRPEDTSTPTSTPTPTNINN
jgi:hypothetical protein